MNGGDSRVHVDIDCMIYIQMVCQICVVDYLHLFMAVSFPFNDLKCAIIHKNNFWKSEQESAKKEEFFY